MALVLLRTYSTTMEAEIVRGFLSTRGVLAFRFEPEADCTTNFAEMARLMVAEEDLDEACTILAEAGN
jgi:hypothetical protein